MDQKGVCHNHNSIHRRGLVLQILQLYGPLQKGKKKKRKQTVMLKFLLLLLCSWTDGTEVQDIYLLL